MGRDTNPSIVTEPASGALLVRSGVTGASLASSQFQSFGQFSEFLRGAVADEESLQMGENLQALSVQVEATMALLACQGVTATQAAAQALMQVAHALRTHRAMVLALGDDWHRFYEFDAHFVALNQFRVLVTAWARDALATEGKLPTPSDFDVAAWRLLGAGAMLLDVYEQSQSIAMQPVDAAVAKPPNTIPLWERAQLWWRRRSGAVVERREGTRRGRRGSDR
jgi:hypothetical protein